MRGETWPFQSCPANKTELAFSLIGSAMNDKMTLWSSIQKQFQNGLDDTVVKEWSNSRFLGGLHREWPGVAQRSKGYCSTTSKDTAPNTNKKLMGYCSTTFFLAVLQRAPFFQQTGREGSDYKKYFR